MQKIAINNKLLTRLSYSPYLAGLINDEASVVVSSESVEGTQLGKKLQMIIASFDAKQEPVESTYVMSFIRQRKREFTTLWSIASVSGQFDFQELGGWWTLFAERSIDFALRAAWQLPEIRRLCTTLPDCLSKPVPGLFVLGLGKLGGRDLNFSSDIDLIAFYDPDLVPVSPMQGKTDVCTRVLKQLTHLLSENTSEGFVWRVDWRLRPEASVNPLAMTVSAGFQFYYFRSLPWHRLAMIKARVVAGDLIAGNQFLSELDSFIWRMNLDYRSLDELADLKLKINLEHPALRLARDQNHEINPDCADFNIKLGRGGIREIEFIVNAMQLIWGGRRVELRIPNTLDAMHQLFEHKLLDEVVVKQMASAYRFFRQVENAVQMYDNQQQYQLPTTEEKQQALLQILGVSCWSLLTDQLYKQRLFVADEFDVCFAENEIKQQAGITTNRLLNEDLSPGATEIVNGWLNGFQIYGVANFEVDELNVLLEFLTTELYDAGRPVNDAIVKIDEFFRSMPTGVQYFRLLQAHPVLLKSIVRPLLLAPPMATLLEQSPHIVDALISPEQYNIQFSSQGRSDFVLASDRFEVRTERLRRFVNEELYIAYHALLSNQISTTQLHQKLTDIAEHTLDLGLDINCDQLQLESSPIAVIGLGKLGMQSMSPMSDLDLIFIARSIDDIESANRFARRFQHLMETRMKEGIAYEMDMRLRPSGRSGPPTVSLDSFEKYHQNRAQTWEHIALLPGRVVSGNQGIGEEAGKIREKLLMRPRDHQQFINDAWKMLDRIRDQRTVPVSVENLSVKLRQGGLMEADYLCACIAIQEIPAHSDWANLRYSELLESISSHTRYVDLGGIVKFWRILQVWVRLLNLEASEVAEFPDQELDYLLTEIKLDNRQQLIEKMNESANTICNYIDQFMSGRSIQSKKMIDEWEEQAVIWL